jgi:TRAP-type C4-dicarboxylate transport system permease small subunit
METILKVKAKLDDIIGYFVGLILLVMAIAIVASVSGRLVNAQIAWVSELVRAGVVWTTFLGAYVAIAKKKDIRVEIITSKLPPKIKLVVDLIADGFVLIFLYFFVQLSFLYVQQFASYKMPMTGMTRGLLYSVFPAGSVLMMIHYLLGVFIKIKALFSSKSVALKDGK